jgi:Tol biopolymer transport system component
LNLVVGYVERLSARAYDSSGRQINATPVWSSADPAIASVRQSDGAVTAISAGTTAVTAAVGVLRATVTVSVIEIAGTIAFTRMTCGNPCSITSDALLYSIADRTLQSLARPGQFPSIAAPAWSPDGTQLAVEVIHSDVVLPNEEGLDYSSDLYVLRAAAPTDSEWRALTANGRSRSPSWSPEGTRIAYVGPATVAGQNQIYVINAGGGEPVRLTQAEGWYSTPRWSPDGTRLTFSYWAAAGNSDVFIVNADGSGLTNVTQNAAYDGEPNWSPDGTRLAFVSDRNRADNNTYRSDVFVVDVNGGNVRSLTATWFGRTYASGPVWSPDGRALAFALATEGSPASIYVMTADGSSPVRLTTPPPRSWDVAPAWRR